jgi:hypothetical protein
MLTQEMLGADAVTTPAVDPNAALWTLPAFNGEPTTFRFAWRWVGATGSAAQGSHEEKYASDMFQQIQADPNICYSEYYVDGVLKQAFKAQSKPACPRLAADIAADAARSLVADSVSFYQKHKKALWIAGGVLGATVAAGTVLLVRRGK